jgi:hypothetical protein
MLERSGFRFQRWTLLFIVLAIGAGLAGYRAGFQWGKSKGERDHRLYVVVYSISPAADSSRLIQTMKSSISPESWGSSGGPGSISLYRDKVVVLQTEPVHADVAAFFHRTVDRHEED